MRGAVMDKQTRKGIIWGVWTTIIGLLISFVVTPILARMMAPDERDLFSTVRGGNPFALVEKVQSTNNFLSLIYLGGLAVAVLGVLFAAVVWTKWFAGRGGDDAAR
jgi:O-antigen/teichoic acid export membrane protein